jgi:hypothetical protein
MLALALVVSAAACGNEQVPCEQRPGVVACVDGTPVMRPDVEAHLEYRGSLPGQATPLDARRVAVDEAVRVRVFAAEAAARGLRAPDGTPPAQRAAVLNQALIRDERARQRIGAEHVSDDEARRFYDANPGRINTVDAVHCYALYTDTPQRAEQLYRELMSAGRDGARDGVVRDRLIAAGGTDIGTIRRLDESKSVDLLRLAATLRTQGAIAGPVRAADGRYLLLYADALEMKVAPFEGTIVARTKNLIARERERAALDALAQRLRAKTQISIVQAAVDALPVPQPTVLETE